MQTRTATDIINTPLPYWAKNNTWIKTLCNKSLWYKSKVLTADNESKKRAIKHIARYFYNEKLLLNTTWW